VRRLAVLLVVLATACSLPLPSGVHEVGETPAAERLPEPLQVVPPGPKRGASPNETVLGFLGAQASPDDRHAVARDFLTSARDRLWRDDAGVQLYDPTRLEVSQLSGTPTRAVVQARFVVLGEISTDGAYTPLPESVVTEDYALERVAGEWRLAAVGDGLRLTVADRDRALRAVTVHYVVPPVGRSPRHLVADPVFLPLGPEFVTSLVRRQLLPPSTALAASVVTAVPEGTRLGGDVSVTDEGVVTVSLTVVGASLREQQVRDLSAQLTWTLRSLPEFTGLRLNVNGTPVRGPGIDEVQPPDLWDSYDPEGLGPNPPYFYVSHRRLRSSLDLPGSSATIGSANDRGAVAVDGVAVAPDRTQVALVQGRPGEPVTVRVGTVGGRSFKVVAQGELASPTWGSGGHGLWMVRGRKDIVRLTPRGMERVSVDGLTTGPLDGLALSRDGVRVSLVADGHLYLGRVAVVRGVPRVVDVEAIVPGLSRITQVSWQSGTQLLALGTLTRSAQLVRVAVDGSSVVVLPTSGLVPTAVSAVPSGVLSVSGGRLFLSTGGPFELVRQGQASAPAFPG
jgi:hypothetical protein